MFSPMLRSDAGEIHSTSTLWREGRVADKADELELIEINGLQRLLWSRMNVAGNRLAI